MTKGDRQVDRSRQSADLLVIGGGIMGLWAACHAARAGMTVRLVDAGLIGGGASGGLLGALMPHMPDRWNEKKQFQFDALVSLELEIAALEAQTGLSAGYRRTGRLIPLPKPHLGDIALKHEQDALRHWRSGDRHFYWHVRSYERFSGLVSEEYAAAGLVEDTLAARVAPRALVALLKSVLDDDPLVTLCEHCVAKHLDPEGTAELSDGTRLAFGHAIIANGYQSQALIEALAGPLNKPVVVPVKGQAALLAADLDPATPVIYLDGLYIVPHEGGRVAVGSTSENRFVRAFDTDGQLDALITRARDLTPALRDAPVLERWAGLRPKAIGRDPMVGRLPGQAKLSVLTGGFKVSFGLAHALAAQLLYSLGGDGGDPALPAGFLPQSHLREAGFAV